MLVMKDLVQSLGDYTAAAMELLTRFDTARVAHETCLEMVKINPDAEVAVNVCPDRQREEQARLASRLMDAMSDRLWEELEIFENRKV
jgi:hypothetical protein